MSSSYFPLPVEDSCLGQRLTQFLSGSIEWLNCNIWKAVRCRKIIFGDASIMFFLITLFQKRKTVSSIVAGPGFQKDIKIIALRAKKVVFDYYKKQLEWQKPTHKWFTKYKISYLQFAPFACPAYKWSCQHIQHRDRDRRELVKKRLALKAYLTTLKITSFKRSSILLLRQSKSVAISIQINHISFPTSNTYSNTL